jgi:hypothetical protein
MDTRRPLAYSHAMLKDVLMLILCLGTIGTHALLLRRFFRRLQQIEDEYWGEAAARVDSSRLSQFFAGQSRRPTAPTPAADAAEPSGGTAS